MNRAGYDFDNLKELGDLFDELIDSSTECYDHYYNKCDNSPISIRNVIFNKPATIVFWSDGTKTVVKAQGKEKFDKEKGLAMAISKRMAGNSSAYYDIFKKYCDK